MKNKYEILGDTVAIYIIRRSGELITTYVDLDDLDRLNELSGSWCAKRQKDGKVYFFMNQYPSSTHLWLHRFINNTPPKLLTDHIDNDTLNNKKLNLRTATPNMNQQNPNLRKSSKSGMPGVQWDKSIEKWRVRIRVDGKDKLIGRYKSLETAKRECVNARKKYHPGFVNSGN